MYFTSTIFLAKLLAAIQVLVTLDMLWSTTTALPVTSKPIESTVENSAWQAWIELPPEQKQQVKSRKVTPKSIFTLPLRVECPEGHKQVDTKCIPIVIGNNDVLIDLNALGLLVGNTQAEDLYDYEDMDEELPSPLPNGSQMPARETEKSVEDLNVELKPPAKDEPLKFNIFENKFHIFSEDPLEDYGPFSNEGWQGPEKAANASATAPQSTKETVATNATSVNDSLSEASHLLENKFEFHVPQEQSSSGSEGPPKESDTATTATHVEELKVGAISVPAFSLDDSSIHFTDAEAATTTDDRRKVQETDLQTLLQTESFLPLLNQTTASTQQNSAAAAESSSARTSSLQEQEPTQTASDVLSLDLDEETTTSPNGMEQDIAAVGNKQEHARSVTASTVITEITRDSDDHGENDQLRDSTLETGTNVELAETTTPIQLDETTVIETDSLLSFTPPGQPELQELLKQAEKEFEELQHKRKGGEKDQHVVSKKSKVQPVAEWLSTTTEVSDKATTTTGTASVSMPTATKTADELIASSAATERVVTPLLAAHNESDSNDDRFYDQDFENRDNKVTQRSDSEFKQGTTATASDIGMAATKATEVETTPLTSEIDLSAELRLINELVKGIHPYVSAATTTSTVPTTTTPTTPTTTTTTTSDKPKTSASNIILYDELPSSLSPNYPRESSPVSQQFATTTSQTWAKRMPFASTTTTTFRAKDAPNAHLHRGDQKASASSIPLHGIRNSKVIRINDFHSMALAKTKTTPSSTPSSTTAATVPTAHAFDDTSPSLTVTSTAGTASGEVPEPYEANSTYASYWWLPVSWRLEAPATSVQSHEEPEVNGEQASLLLRFWSAFAPKSS